MNMDDLFVRMDESSLTKFLSKPVIEVLQIDDPDAIRLKHLARLIREFIPMETFLRDSRTRNIIINVMHDDEAEEFAKFLGIKKWENVHYKLTHIKFTKITLIKTLKFFGKEYEEDETSRKEDCQEISPEKFLFSHQIVTVKKVQDLLEEPPHKVLLHMPTGSGKTMSAMRIVITHLLKDPSSLVIWLAHNEELCEQAMEEFQQIWKNAGDRKINTYRFFGKSRLDPLSVENGFMSAGLLKMLGSAKKSNTFLAKLALKTDLVIVDEAHQATAEKFSIIIEELSENKNTKLLGLSATPGRTSNYADSENKHLANFFANQKIMLDTGKQNPVTFLIKKGYLANPTFTPIKYLSDGLSKKDIQKIEKNLDVPYAILEKLSNDAKRNLSIIREITRLSKNHKKIIIFASTVEHARDISLILSAKKYNSYYVVGKTPTEIRAKILNDYKNDDADMILCNYGILTMGFDAPKTSAIVIARPTKSYVLYAQMVGRAIRGPKAGGNKTCEISTVMDKDIGEFINITDIFTRWEKVWSE